MKVNIVVPHVGEAISEVALARWLKRAGETVKAGEPLFVVDIDKAELEVEAAEDGVLSEILAPEGSSVMPLDVIGVLDVAHR
jgi:pyruvate/2-oxoglutarate dehydrogenase complex dihydrolipoamide acyltransferase (E2) component